MNAYILKPFCDFLAHVNFWFIKITVFRVVKVCWISHFCFAIYYTFEQIFSNSSVLLLDVNPLHSRQCAMCEVVHFSERPKILCSYKQNIALF